VDLTRTNFLVVGKDGEIIQGRVKLSIPSTCLVEKIILTFSHKSLTHEFLGTHSRHVLKLLIMFLVSCSTIN